MLRSKKGQVGFYIAFIILAVIIVVIGALAAPLGARISTEFYAVGVNLLNDTRYNPVASIDDPLIRAQLESTFDSAIDAGETNIEVSTSLFEFSWVFLLIIIGIVFFLLTKQAVPYQRGGVF